MTSLFYLLLRHPHCYAKVQAEVDAVYPNGSDALDSSKHAELKYLNACMYVYLVFVVQWTLIHYGSNEALRINPPSPTSGPRQVPRGSGGKIIAGRYVFNIANFVFHLCAHLSLFR